MTLAEIAAKMPSKENPDHSHVYQAFKRPIHGSAYYMNHPTFELKEADSSGLPRLTADDILANDWSFEPDSELNA